MLHFQILSLKCVPSRQNAKKGQRGGLGSAGPEPPKTRSWRAGDPLLPPFEGRVSRECPGHGACLIADIPREQPGAGMRMECPPPPAGVPAPGAGDVPCVPAHSTLWLRLRFQTDKAVKRVAAQPSLWWVCCLLPSFPQRRIFKHT